MIKRFYNAKITGNGVIVLIVKRTRFDSGKGRVFFSEKKIATEYSKNIIRH